MAPQAVTKRSDNTANPLESLEVMFSSEIDHRRRIYQHASGENFFVGAIEKLGQEYRA